jgi:adenylate cyclase class IV
MKLQPPSFDREQVLLTLDKLLGVNRKSHAKEHKLKWKLPEQRLSFSLKDAELTVAGLKKNSVRFVGGGEYSEIVHAKDMGGMFAYMLVRTDSKTEEETIVAETYMLQEEDKLGFDITSAFKFAEDLEQIGYVKAFDREYDVWRFLYFEVPVTVYAIRGFGDFLELALPATNFPRQRERAQKHAYELAEKLGFKKEEAMGTDVVTLQLAAMMDAAQKGGQKQRR